MFTSNKKNSVNLVLALTNAALMAFSVIILDLIGVYTENNAFICNSTYFSEYNKVLPVFCAVFMFQYFKNIKIESEIINRVAKSTLGIYLLHDGSLRNWIWLEVWPLEKYIRCKYVCLFLVVKVMLVYLICLFIDQIWRFLYNEVEKRIIIKNKC